jgi:hypothetical protein
MRMLVNFTDTSSYKPAPHHCSLHFCDVPYAKCLRHEGCPWFALNTVVNPLCYLDVTTPSPPHALDPPPLQVCPPP